MTTMDTSRRGRRPALVLTDTYCHPVTYRGTTVLRCSLCGRLPSAVLAHFESTHPEEFTAAGGRPVADGAP